MAKIAIIGGSSGGLTAAFELKRLQERADESSLKSGGERWKK